MNETYEHAAWLLTANADRHPEDEVDARFSYQAGFYGRLVLRAAVAYGRSLGVAIDVQPAGGFLVRSGWVVARGQWRDVRRFLQVLA